MFDKYNNILINFILYRDQKNGNQMLGFQQAFWYMNSYYSIFMYIV